MDFAQEHVATLHDLEGSVPPAPTDEACVVVPMMGRECESRAAGRVFSTLERIQPGRVVVALRASADAVGDYVRWLDGFDVDLDVLWCTADPVDDLLAERGLDGAGGKGRDLWLALGVAADAPYVVCHDADPTSYSEAYVARLLAPLADGFAFTKGFYARVEDGRLYGRLYRLLYAPLIEALRSRIDAPILRYLAAFRYALAGEFALSGDLARRVRVERRFGLEVGLLGEAFDLAGVDGTAQVDLGRYRHDHRSVAGSGGLAEMSEDVAGALFRILEERGAAPAYEELTAAYRDAADGYVRNYAADAAFNGLAYDEAAERDQVDAYAEAIRSPGPDSRLPPWTDADLDPEEVRRASRRALDDARVPVRRYVDDKG